MSVRRAPAFAARARPERAGRALPALAAGALGPWLLLTCLAGGLAPRAHAQTAGACLPGGEVQDVPEDWPLIPRDFNILDVRNAPGMPTTQPNTEYRVDVVPAKSGKFRLLFVTTRTHSARSDDIGVYNDFVKAEAARGHPALRPYADHFCALASTSDVTARDNTRTNYEVTGASGHYGSVSGTANVDTDDSDGTKSDSRHTPVYWLDRDATTRASEFYIGGAGENRATVSSTAVAGNNYQLHRANASAGGTGEWVTWNGQPTSPRDRNGALIPDPGILTVWTGTEHRYGTGNEESQLGQETVAWGRPTGRSAFVFMERDDSVLPREQRHRFYALSGVFQVVDRDTQARVSLSASSTSVQEAAGATGRVTITATADRKMSNGDLVVPIVVRRNDSTATGCATGNTANCDFTLMADPADTDSPKDYSVAAGTITIKMNQSTGTLQLQAQPDESDEPNETAVIAIGRTPRTGAYVADFAPGKNPQVEITILDANETRLTLDNGDFGQDTLEGDPQDRADIVVGINRRLAAGEMLAVPLKFEHWDLRAGSYVEATNASTGLGEFTILLDGSPSGVSFDPQTRRLVFSGPMPEPEEGDPEGYSARFIVSPVDDDDADVEIFRVSAATSTLSSSGSGANAFSGGLLGDNGCRAPLQDRTKDLADTLDPDLCDEQIFGILINDDDERGVVSTHEDVTVTEGGAEWDPAGNAGMGARTTGHDTAVYRLALASDPVAAVTVELVSLDEDAATVSPESIAFTSSDWSTPKTVTVTAVNDADSRDESVIIAHRVTAANARDPYLGVAVDDVTVAVTDDDPVVVFSASSSSVNEGVAGNVRIELSGVARSDFRIDYAVTGDAVIESDYQIQYDDDRDDAFTRDAGNPGTDSMGTVLVKAGESAVIFRVSSVDDTNAESDESVILTLLNPDAATGGYTIGTEIAHTVTIEDDDTPEFTVDAIDASVAEGAPARFRITHANAVSQPLLGPTDVSLLISDDVRAGGLSDFIDNSAEPPEEPAAATSAEGAHLVRFTPQGPTSIEFTVATVADGVDEPSGEVSLAIVDGAGYNARDPSSASVPVTDDDATTVTLDIADADAAEGDADETAAIRLVLGRPLVDGEILTVPVAFANAVAGINYSLALGGAPTGIAFDAETSAVTFTGPERGTSASTAVLTLTAVDDTDMISEAIVVSIPATTTGARPVLGAVGLDGGAEGRRPGNGRIDIADDDVPGVTVSDARLTVSEGGDAAEYTVVLDSAPPATVEVAILSSDRDAAVVPSVPLLFSPDTWDMPQSVEVAPVDDLDSANESVTVSHTVTGYGDVTMADPVIVTVLDDDPEASFGVPTARVGEDAGEHAVTVRLSPAAPRDMTFNYTVDVSGDSPAAQGRDWSVAGLAGTAGSVEVEADEDSFTIPLTVIDDEVAEGGETVTFVLGGPVEGDPLYTVGEVNRQVITIADNDIPEITIDADADEVAEDSATSANFTVSSSHVPENALAVRLLVSETGDFVHATDEGAKTVTIEPGASTAAYSVPIVDDRNDEPDGVVRVAVRSSPDYTGIPSASMAAVDDDPTIVSLTVRDPTADEDDAANTAQITVGLDRGLVDGEELSVPLLFEGGSPDSDFSLKLVGNPTGVAFGDSTLTFTGPESGASAELVALTLTALDDSDATEEEVKVSVPATSTQDPPRLDASTLSGGAIGRVLGEGEVTIRDSDISGVAVRPTFLSLAEESAGEYTVVLTTDPGGEVTIVATPEDTSKVTADPGSLRFNSGNWDSPQTVSVTAQDDPDSDDERLRIEHRVVGYAGVPSADAVMVQVTDNDPEASFTRASSRAGESFGASDVSIILSPAPAESIEIGYRVSGTASPPPAVCGEAGEEGGDFSIEGLDCGSDGSIIGTLAVARGASSATISVEIVDDNDSEGNETVLLTLYSLNDTYTVGGAFTHTFTISDDDRAGVGVSPQSLSLTEGADGTYSVVLLSSPEGEVTVEARSSDEGAVTFGEQGTATSAVLTFTPDDWDEPQQITVSPRHDADSRDERVIITHTISGYGSVSSAGAVSVGVADEDPEVSFARSASTAAESAGTTDIAISLTRAAERPIMLRWCVDGASTAEPGTTGEGGDYTVPAPLDGDGCGVAEVARDSSEARISFTVEDDLVAEGSETIVLTLADADADAGGGQVYTVAGTRRHVLTIADNDSGGVTVTPTSLDLEEGESGSYTVVLSSDPGGAATLTINSGDPRAVALSTQALIFTSLNWDMPQTVVVSASQDDDEDDEAATIFHDIVGYHGVSGVDPVEVAVTDDDGGPPPSIATVGIEAGGGVEEGGTAIFTLIAAPAPDAEFTVNVTVVDAAGVAGPGQAGSRPVSIGTDGVGALTVATVDDDTEGAGARIVATLGDGPGYTVALPPRNQAVVAVNDNDAAPPQAVPEVAFGSPAEDVGEDGTVHAVRLTVAPAPTASIALNYVLSGTARQGADYMIDGVVAGAGAVAVPAGATGAVIVVEIADDRLSEEDETAVFTLTGGEGYTVGGVSEYTLTLTDDDTPGVSVTPASVTLDEGTSDAAYSVALDTDPGRTVTVTPSSGDPGGATVSGALIFDSRNWQTPQAVVVSALEDADAADETVTIFHTVAGYADIVTAAEVTVSVVDDEAAASVVGIAGGGAVVEGELAVFRLTASPPPPGQVVVNVVVTDAAGVAATGQSGNRPVAIGPGGEATLTVATLDDDLEEPAGVLTATVAPGDGYTVADGPGHVAEVEVGDDDAPPVSTVPVASFVLAGQAAGEFVGARGVAVSLVPSPAEPMVLNYTVAGTADPGPDYTIEGLGEDGAGTVEVPAGATGVDIPVVIAEDNRDEPDETLVLTLAAGEGYTVGAAGAHTLTIGDNDEAPAMAEQAAPSMARLGRSLTDNLLDSVGARLAAAPSGALSPPLNGGPFSLRIAGRKWSELLAGWRPAGPGLAAAPGGGAGAPGMPGTGAGPPRAGGIGAAAAGIPGESPIFGAAGGYHELSSGQGLGAGSGFELRLDELLRGAVVGSSFLGLGPRLGGGRFGFWGRGADSRFAGDDGEGYSIDGGMTSVQLGADWTRVWLTLGVMASSGSGEGRYSAGTVQGDVELSLTGLTPYMGYELGPRASVWGALNVSEGELTMKPDAGGETVADLAVSSLSGGGRGEVYAGDGGVLSLSVISDLSLMRAETSGEAGLEGVTAESGRLRLAVESAWTFAMPVVGGTIEGRLEAGLRGDGGDGAEGFGAEMAGGVSLSGAGLTLDLEARGLAVHEEEAFRQQGVSLLLAWDPVREDALGPVATLRQGWGADTAGSVEQLYHAEDIERFAGGRALAGGAGRDPARLDLELGWGVPWHRGLYVLTPSVTYRDHGHGRNAGAGWRLAPSAHNGIDLSASLRAVWRERAGFGASGADGAGVPRSVIAIGTDAGSAAAAPAAAPAGPSRAGRPADRSVEFTFQLRW